MLSLANTMNPFVRFAHQMRKPKATNGRPLTDRDGPIAEVRRGPNGAADIRPHMSAEESACYEALLAQSETVVEYGVGGSTLLALKQRGVRKLVSVESDPAWVEQLEGVQTVADAIDRDIAKLIYVNIGKVGSWGKPIDREMADQWFRYPAAPFDHLPEPDLILIDGRFRVACIMEAVLRAQPKTVIAVHDFWVRPKYHVVLPFLDWQESCGTLGVFSAKAGVNRKSAARLLEASQMLFD